MVSSPVIAQHSASSPALAAGVGTRRLFPLHAVRLLDGPFRDAQLTDIDYVLSLDVDRLTAPYLDEAGLEPEAPRYGNWESEGLGGHIGGHYLSACAQLYAATGDERMLARSELVLDAFGRAQSASGTGYLGGVPDGRSLFDDLAAGRVDADLFSLDGRWVPLYNLHKTFAGLIDAAVHTGSGRALVMAEAWADWWLGVSSTMSDDAFEAMLHTEFGGMGDAFAQLGELTGRSDLVREAVRFSHHALLDPLVEGRDELNGLHANTQIPKVVGYARLAAMAETDADPSADARGDLYRQAASVFWRTVVDHRTVAIGGNSVREHFHPSDDFSSMILERQGPETCNSYNMQKLTALLRDADALPAGTLLDAYERTAYNHLLSSQHPGRGGFVYFTPMRPSHYRVYSQPDTSMWCCVGSGLENHARYGELIYGRHSDGLSVDLYLSSTLDWADRGLAVTMTADLLSSNDVRIEITATGDAVGAAVRLRRPGWATAMSVVVDGHGGAVDASVVDTDGRVVVAREWVGTTTIDITFETTVGAERLPDGSDWAAFRYGPVVLAARGESGDSAGLDGLLADARRMAHVAAGPVHPLSNTPIVRGADPSVSVRVVSRSPLRAEVVGIDGASGRAVAVALEPFAGIHDSRYTIYWPVLPIGDGDGDGAGAAAEAAATVGEADAVAKRFARLVASDAAEADGRAVVDIVVAGEQQPESDHGFEGEATRGGGAGGVHWRSATGWFAYVLTDPDERASVVRVRFRQAEGGGASAHVPGLLSLGAVELGDPVSRTEADGVVVCEWAVTGSMRPHDENEHGMRFVVTAPAGAASGDLLSVELREH